MVRPANLPYSAVRGVVLLGPFFDAGTDSGPGGHCLSADGSPFAAGERRAIDEGSDVFLNGVAPQLTPPRWR